MAGIQDMLTDIRTTGQGVPMGGPPPGQPPMGGPPPGHLRWADLLQDNLRWVDHLWVAG
jgi:hypothetical protein